MRGYSTGNIYSFLVLFFTVLAPVFGFAQIGIDFNTTYNSNCSGAPCNYNGPSILINELMLSPNSNDGSMWGGDTNQRGEWIELYNPNICESIDISCYYLGNNANDGGAYPGGYVIPPGTVVPAAGFALIRGVNAAAVPAALLVENGGNVVELVVTGDGVCVGGGTRLWFPNAGGWFAFYDNNGVPQDAVSWANQSNLNENACVPALTGCGFTGPLANYQNFPNDRKTKIHDDGAGDFMGQSIRRIPDGGAWNEEGSPTYATCNATCVDTDYLSCNGTATAEPQGGTAPFTYLWDDPQAQTTQTANQLCAGTYCVLITDALGITAQECIIVEDAFYESFISDSFCEGDSYTLPNDSIVSAPGIYPLMFQSAGDCDSLVTVELEMHPNYLFNLEPEICANQVYTLPDGTEVQNAGNYLQPFQTSQGCDSVYDINLTILPPVNIPLSAKMCSGSSYELPDGTIVSNAGEYNVLMPGGADACDTMYVVDLQLFPEYDLQIDELSDITCFGVVDGAASLNITGTTGPYSILWSDGEDHGLSASGLEAGNYSVQVSDIHGCESDLSFDIIEPPPVSLTATADTLICIGTESELLAQAEGGTGTFNYSWSHTTSTNASSLVSPTEDTNYGVFATDENGCETETLLLQVAVIAMDTGSLQMMPGDPVCAGGESSVEAFYQGEYPPYSYVWNQGLPVGPGPHVVSPEESTSYELTVSDYCGNEISDQLDITIWPLPVAEVIFSNVSCNGFNDGIAEIIVNGGTPDYFYNWSDGQDHGAAPTGLNPANYFVQLSDANGCETQVSFDINEPPPISINATADTLICIGSDSQLLAQATGGTGPLTYHWSHTNSSDPMSNVSPTEDAFYTVFASDTNACVSETIILEVAVISMDSGLLSISNDTAICAEQSTAISAFYSGEYPPYQYLWSNGLESGPGPHNISPAETTVYELTVTDICGNIVTNEVTIFVNTLPEVILPDLLLNGCSPFTSTLSDPVNTGSDFTHEWIISNTGSIFGNPVTLELTEPGLYEVQLMVTSPEGCSDISDSYIPVEVFDLPEADFIASAWTSDINNPQITFTNTSLGYTSATWIIEDTELQGQPDIYYTFSDTGHYPVKLLVENEFGCLDSITRWINIGVVYDIVIPNAFTPGDGSNPYYDPLSTNNSIFYAFAEYIAAYRMSIFNRWGELIFESDDFNKGWNGTYRDELCPQDVYVYKIDFIFTDGHEISKVGDITLFR